MSIRTKWVGRPPYSIEPVSGDFPLHPKKRSKELADKLDKVLLARLELTKGLLNQETGKLTKKKKYTSALIAT